MEVTNIFKGLDLIDTVSEELQMEVCDITGDRDQCKEIEENNRMGKTIALFKKIRDTRGTFHAKMGSVKDRNGMNLSEAEDIKKR